MEREEAIRWLTDEKWINANNKYKKEWNEAFDMAIEALQTDAVSREEYEEVKAYMNTLVDAFIEDGKELAESVKVVRCKDCKWWQDSEVGVVECPICTRIHDMVFEMGVYDYCSYGERREE